MDNATNHINYCYICTSVDVVTHFCYNFFFFCIQFLFSFLFIVPYGIDTNVYDSAMAEIYV